MYWFLQSKIYMRERQTEIDGERISINMVGGFTKRKLWQENIHCFSWWLFLGNHIISVHLLAWFLVRKPETFLSLTCTLKQVNKVSHHSSHGPNTGHSQREEGACQCTLLETFFLIAAFKANKTKRKPKAQKNKCLFKQLHPFTQEIK